MGSSLECGGRDVSVLRRTALISRYTDAFGGSHNSGTRAPRHRASLAGLDYISSISFEIDDGSPQGPRRGAHDGRGCLCHSARCKSCHIDVNRGETPLQTAVRHGYVYPVRAVRVPGVRNRSSVGVVEI